MLNYSVAQTGPVVPTTLKDAGNPFTSPPFNVIWEMMQIKSELLTHKDKTDTYKKHLHIFLIYILNLDNNSGSQDSVTQLLGNTP